MTTTPILAETQANHHLAALQPEANLPQENINPAVTSKAVVKASTALPVLGSEEALSRYLQEIKRFPVLAPQEEYMLAKRWQDHQDPQAAHKLVTSHLRLVAKLAMGYRGYGLPMSELISEGNIGLMQGVKKFDPEKGFRLATYAMWWIKASMQEFILRSWSLVKIGTTAAQKKLFFNLRRLKSELNAIDEGDMHPDDVKTIAKRLDVSEDEVISMNRRLGMGGDSSLNMSMREDGEGEWQDWLIDQQPLQDEILSNNEESTLRAALLKQALEALNERERHIVIERCLKEPAVTLEELSNHYGISRERVRQIEMRAFEKLKTSLLELAQQQSKGLHSVVEHKIIPTPSQP